MVYLMTSPSLQAFAPVIVDPAAVPLLPTPDVLAKARLPAAEPDCVMVNAPPVMLVPAIEVVTVASAVVAAGPLMVPTSTPLPRNGARTTPTRPVATLARLPSVIASVNGWVTVR